MQALAIYADATSAEAVRSAVQQAANRFGRIDVLVNNAGTAISKPFEEATPDELDQVANFPPHSPTARSLWNAKSVDHGLVGRIQQGGYLRLGPAFDDVESQ